MPPTKTSRPRRTASRRAAVLLAAGAVTAMGLVLHFLAPGDFAGLATDALYTVLVYLILGLVAPKAVRHRLALAAFAVSAAVELAQLTGLPERLAEAFPPSRLVLGTTFSALDLAAYAAGAAAVLAADTALSRRQWRPSRLE